MFQIANLLPRIGLLSFLLLAKVGYADAPEPPYLKLPRNLDHTEVYLLTAGLGSGVEARYGHTILRIVDRDEGQEYNLNWGMFSFDEPNFALNFYLGKLWYWVDSEIYRRVLYRYGKREQRPLLSNKVNLTRQQKRELIVAINASFREQGGRYPYHYFYRNCSTIPRDFFDQILGGAFQTRFAAEPAGMTFRWYVYTYLNSPPPIAFILDIVMNSNIDFVITRWQEMFFPLKLQEYLADFSQVASDEQVALGSPLLGPTEKLNQHSDVSASSWHVYPWWLVVSLLLVVPLVLQRIRREAPSTWALRSFGWYALLWGLFSGLVSTTMMVSWIFSEHLDLHHNANLWLLWPVDFLMTIGGWRLLRGKGLSLQRGLSRWLRRLGYGHVIGFMLVALLWITGVVSQDLSRVLMYLGPGMVLLSLGWIRVFSS